MEKDKLLLKIYYFIMLVYLPITQETYPAWPKILLLIGWFLIVQLNILLVKDLFIQICLWFFFNLLLKKSQEWILNNLLNKKFLHQWNLNSQPISQNYFSKPKINVNLLNKIQNGVKSWWDVLFKTQQLIF